MQVIISNNSKLNTAPSAITVSNINKVGKVTFGKSIALVGDFNLGQLSDVNTTGQSEGDVLVYNANTTLYEIKTLPKIDGGSY
jgi:hypothetical protein